MAEMSVILPVHNGANYLREAIDSVLNQQGVDFELHVLDDCSEDETPRVAQETGDPRVRYSRNPERFGLFKTLNRGFEEARSPLVRIWAHDDRMLSGSLAKFFEFAQRHPNAGMIYCDFFEIDTEGRRTAGEQFLAEQRARTPELASSDLSALLFWVYGCLPGNISTVMLRREAWREGGGFLTGIQQAPDFDMWVRLSARYLVGFIREKAIELRNHPLQLGKTGHKQLTTIEEEYSVIENLKRRLEGVLTPREARRWWALTRGRQHMHWIARACQRGDFTLAMRGWRRMAQYGQPVRQFAYWALTVNGHLYQPPPHRLFDRWVARLPAEGACRKQ